MPKNYVWITVRVANCGDRSFPALRAHDNARRALVTEGHWGLPDVVMYQEVSTVNVRMLGSTRGYDVLQFGRQGSPEAGVALANRMESVARQGSSRMTVGSKATTEGGGIRMRIFVSDRYRPRGAKAKRMSSGHAPPLRSFIARAIYIAALRRQRGLVGLDANFPVKVMKATSVRQYRGEGVLGLLVPRNLKSKPARPVDIGSDHPAVDVLVRIPLKEPRR